MRSLCIAGPRMELLGYSATKINKKAESAKLSADYFLIYPKLVFRNELA